MASSGDRQTFAQRLDALWRAVPNPKTGRPYSARAAAAALTQAGFQVSHTHLTRLRSGQADNPRQSEIDALARLFGVAPSYFATEGPARHDPLAEALAKPGIQAVALRLATAELSSAGVDAIIAVIDHVAKLEVSARESTTPHNGEGLPASHD